MFFVFLVVLQLFLIVGLGCAAGFFKILNKGASDVLSNYAYYFALPALLFIRTAQIPIKIFFDFNAVAAFSLGMISLAFIIFVFCRALKVDLKLCGMFVMLVLFGNIAFLGIPFNTQVYGGISEISTAAALAITIILTNFWALFLGQGIIYTAIGGSKGIINGLKIVLVKIFSNPLILSIILGGLFSALNLKLPEFILKPITAIGDTSGPVALFALGAFFADKSCLRNVRIKPILGLSFAKLFLLPLLVFVFLKIFPIGSVESAVFVAQAAMPFAATNFILAKQFAIAEDITATSIFVSTVASIVTLPLLTTLLF